MNISDKYVSVERLGYFEPLNVLDILVSSLYKDSVQSVHIIY